MDGFSLTETLRNDKHYGNVPIIIVTSREKEEDKKRGIRVGAYARIVKGAFDWSNLPGAGRS
jgi:two-component system, chemotaxis family, sensor kinase CheA